MSDRRRILVLANETCAGAAVCDEVRYRAGHDPADVLVVAPTLAESRMGHWLSSSHGPARDAARERLEASVAALRATGLDAKGQLGDSDPLQALDDAFRVFMPDEIIISTHPPAHSNWLERRVVQRARERYSAPVTHVVVDLVHEAALTHDDPRPGPRSPRPTVTLYRVAGYDEALAAQTRGFQNSQHDGGRSGVLFADSADTGATVDDPTVFVVEIPTPLVEPYEIAEQDGQRRYVLPAELVNRHYPRALVTDWSE
jgi:hypothetical protein